MIGWVNFPVSVISGSSTLYTHAYHITVSLMNHFNFPPAPHGPQLIRPSPPHEEQLKKFIYSNMMSMYMYNLTLFKHTVYPLGHGNCDTFRRVQDDQRWQDDVYYLFHCRNCICSTRKARDTYSTILLLHTIPLPLQRMHIFDPCPWQKRQTLTLAVWGTCVYI